MSNKTEQSKNDWQPAYKAKLENIVGDNVVVKAVALTDACMLMYTMKDTYRYVKAIEAAGEKNHGLYLFKKV